MKYPEHLLCVTGILFLTCSVRSEIAFRATPEHSECAQSGAAKANPCGVSYVAVNSDGTLIATGDSCTGIMIWNSKTGAKVLQISSEDAYGVRVIGPIAFSPEGNTVAIVSGTKVRVFDSTNGKVQWEIPETSSAATDITFSPDGRLVAVAYARKFAKLWDVSTRKEFLSLEGHSGRVLSIAMSPDGKWIATGSQDKTIKLWDAATGKEKYTLAGHRGFVLGLSFDPKGRFLTSIAGNGDRTVRIWDIDAGKQFSVIEAPVEGLTKVSYSPDGKVLTTSGGKDVILWQVPGEQLLGFLKGHTSNVNSLAFAPDGSWLASGSDDGTVKIWNLSTQTLTLTINDRPVRPSQRVVEGSKN